MKRLVKPSAINGKIKAPCSKSMIVRALACAALARGKSVVGNFSNSEDAAYAIACTGALGADIQIDNDKIIVDGRKSTPSEYFNCGESALAMRIFTSIAATFDFNITINGIGSLKRRNTSGLIQTLIDSGVEIRDEKSFVPFNIKGPFRTNRVFIDCSQSSQYLTGLLIALPSLFRNLTIAANNLNGNSYPEITLSILSKFGINYHVERNLYILRNNFGYKPANIDLEGDFTGSAYLAFAAALGGKIQIDNLHADSTQSDSGIVDFLQKIGAKTHYSGNLLEIKSNNIKQFDFDATDNPDTVPGICVLATQSGGTCRIKVNNRLRNKESDRVKALLEEFSSVGMKIDFEDNKFVVQSGKIAGGEIDARNDHRIAMAGALLGLVSDNGVAIKGSECVNKSYPGFWNDLKHCGADVNELDR